MRLQESECGFGVDAVSLHEDAFGLFDDSAAADCALQVLELREPPKCDVESVLELAGVVSIENDVGEDTARGGLEHMRSSVCGASPHAFDGRTSLLELWSLLAHEHFHVWNVKRLRPVELGPFNYEDEVHTRSLWIAEGITD